MNNYKTRKIKPIRLLVFIFLLQVSCEKKEEETIKDVVDGYIYDAVLNTPVAGAKVELWQDDRGGTTRRSDFDRVLNTTFSDSNGYYRMEFTCNVYKQNAILAIKEGYFDGDVDMSIFSCNRRNVNYNLPPLSTYKFNIKNVNPYNEFDTLSLLNKKYVGEHIDTVIYWQQKTSNPIYVVYSIIKNNVKKSQLISGSCGHMDTCVINIHY